MDNNHSEPNEAIIEPLPNINGTAHTIFNGALNYRLPVFAALSLIIGIVLSAAVYNNLTVVTVFYIAFSLFLVAGLVLAFFKKRLYVWVALFLLAGFFLYNIHYTCNLTGNYVVEDAVLTGRVARAEQDANGQNVYLIEDVRIDAGHVKGNAYLYCETIFMVGARISASGTLTAFDWDPFQYQSMSYYNSGVKYTMTGETVHYLSMDKLSPAEKVRERIKNGYATLLSEDSAGIALSLVLGDKSLLPRETKDYFRASGLSHIFAVSGLHIGFLVGIIFFFCKKARLGRYTAFAVSFIAMLCYGTVAGFSASITRAIIMTTVGFAGFLLYRRPDPLNILALAAIILLVCKPLSLFEVGFQLSFAAVLGIVCFYRPLQKCLTFGKGRIAKAFADLAAVSLAANTLLVAVAINAFSTFGIYFCLSNLLVIPFVGVLYAFLMTATVLFLIYAPLGALIVPFDYPFIAIKYIVAFISQLPYAVAETSEIGLLAIIYVFAMLYMSRFFMVNIKTKYRVLTGIIGFSLFYAIVFL
ncbi:MAG: ComEC/Rec2 family competence protein [Clostridia bacterium]|nr:ComEC/Rec2 family competence protein [Clostridia bacterium]